MSQKIALVVEDTDANRVFFERILKQAGYEVYSAASGQATRALLTQLPTVDLAVIDMEIPDDNGLDITAYVRNLFPESCVVVATMHDERRLMQKAFNRGCHVFMVKPHGTMELYKRLTTIGTQGIKQAGTTIIDQYGVRGFEVYTS